MRAALILILLTAGCLAPAHVTVTTAPPGPGVLGCVHEFCTIAAANATVAGVPGRLLVRGTLPVVELSASAELVVWSAPDNVANRSVAFFAYERGSGHLFEYPIDNSQGLENVVVHENEVIFTVGPKTQNATDARDVLHLWDGATGDDRLLPSPGQEAILPLQFDGTWLLFLTIRDGGPVGNVMNVGNGTTYRVDAAAGAAALRDGVLYTLVPGNQTTGDPGKVVALDLATRSNSTAFTLSHAAAWVYPVTGGFVTADDHGVWSDQSGQSVKVSASGETFQDPLLVSASSDRPWVFAAGPSTAQNASLEWLGRQGQPAHTLDLGSWRTSALQVEGGDGVYALYQQAGNSYQSVMGTTPMP
ncbi:MAG: hypothetical protein ACYDBQ_01980 [Thermoplasmatota archaeon]